MPASKRQKAYRPPKTTRVCIVCGKKFQGTRAQYCSDTCRSRARRARIYADRAARARRLSKPLRQKLEKLRGVLPHTAAYLDKQLSETDAVQLERSLGAVFAALAETGWIINGSIHLVEQGQ